MRGLLTYEAQTGGGVLRGDEHRDCHARWGTSTDVHLDVTPGLKTEHGVPVAAAVFAESEGVIACQGGPEERDIADRLIPIQRNDAVPQVGAIPIVAAND